MLLLSCQYIKKFNLAELLLGRTQCPEVGFLMESFLFSFQYAQYPPVLHQ